MIAIIDYGLGNLASVMKAVTSLKKNVVITCDKKEIQKASLIILPGVGSFEQGMRNLKDRGLVELLTEEVIHNKKPFLGICLGMQLIMERGTEPTECDGLGWIKGKVEAIKNSRLPVPWVGITPINLEKKIKKILCQITSILFIAIMFFLMKKLRVLM